MDFSIIRVAKLHYKSILSQKRFRAEMLLPHAINRKRYLAYSMAAILITLRLECP